MVDETPTKGPSTPSWLKWPPNCCETCRSWQRTSRVVTIAGDIVSDFIGICNDPVSLNNGEITDTRYRCSRFKRKEGV